MKGGKQAGSKGRREGGKGRAGFAAGKVGGGAQGQRLHLEQGASGSSRLDHAAFRMDSRACLQCSSPTLSPL